MNLLIVKISKGHKNIFSDPSKIFKNILWHINICLKYFMTPSKTFRSLRTYLNVRSLTKFKNFLTLISFNGYMIYDETYNASKIWNPLKLIITEPDITLLNLISRFKNYL